MRPILTLTFDARQVRDWQWFRRWVTTYPIWERGRVSDPFPVNSTNPLTSTKPARQWTGVDYTLDGGRDTLSFPEVQVNAIFQHAPSGTIFVLGNRAEASVGRGEHGKRLSRAVSDPLWFAILDVAPPWPASAFSPHVHQVTTENRGSASASSSVRLLRELTRAVRGLNTLTYRRSYPEQRQSTGRA